MKKRFVYGVVAASVSLAFLPNIYAVQYTPNQVEEVETSLIDTQVSYNPGLVEDIKAEKIACLNEYENMLEEIKRIFRSGKATADEKAKYDLNGDGRINATDVSICSKEICKLKQEIKNMN